MSDTEQHKVRLDKWLWAARFFKTRGLAKQAIEGGKVEYNGARSKPSRFVEVGAILKIPQGWDTKEVVVRALSDQRRQASEASQLYEETADSLARRAQEAERRKLLKERFAPEQRPTKKQRRQIHRFKQQHDRG